MVTFGIEFLANEPAEKLSEIVRLSEENGLSYAWITDHYNNRDAFSLLTYIAARTDSIKLGPGVTNPYTRTAPQLASAIATLHEVSDGRAVLGIGPGDRITFEKLGIEWMRPVRTVRETVSIIRQLLACKKVSYNGEIFKTKDAKLDFATDLSDLPDVPVYIGAQGPKMLHLAGEVGDGVLVNASHPLDFAEAIPALKAGGADLATFDVAAYTSFSIADRKDDAISAAKPVVAFIVAGSPPGVLERHEIPPGDVEAVRNGFKKSFSDAIHAVTGDMIDAFAICGTPAECMDRIEELVNAGVTQVIPGSPIGPDRIRAIRLIGEDIIPNWR